MQALAGRAYMPHQTNMICQVLTRTLHAMVSAGPTFTPNPPSQAKQTKSLRFSVMPKHRAPPNHNTPSTFHSPWSLRSWSNCGGLFEPPKSIEAVLLRGRALLRPEVESVECARDVSQKGSVCDRCHAGPRTLDDVLMPSPRAKRGSKYL